MRPTSGEFSINNYDFKEGAVEIRQSIGMLSHSPLLYEDLTAYENLQFYGKMFNVKPGTLHNRIKSLLRQVGLAHVMYDRVGTFSRGMKQRLSISRAIIHKPKVLLLDEPYTSLDQNGSDVLDNILRKFHAKPGTIVMTTHNLKRGLKNSDRIAILVSGRISFESELKSLDIKKFTGIYQKLIK